MAGDVAQRIGSYLLKGYTMLASTCAKCHSVPLLRDKHGDDLCVACDEAEATSPVSDDFVCFSNEGNDTNNIAVVASPERNVPNDKPNNKAKRFSSTTTTTTTTTMSRGKDKKESKTVHHKVLTGDDASEKRVHWADKDSEGFQQEKERTLDACLYRIASLADHLLGGDRIGEILDSCKMLSLYLDTLDLLVSTLRMEDYAVDEQMRSCYSKLLACIGPVYSKVSTSEDQEENLQSTHKKVKLIRKLCKLLKRVEKYR